MFLTAKKKKKKKSTLLAAAYYKNTKMPDKKLFTNLLISVKLQYLFHLHHYSLLPICLFLTFCFFLSL
eukprot:NODE_30583_length_415_cov_0.815972.p1 GENE.NODE_30583_length_415_cov_0.815972~~NODE_30583_length_415_cov_0.815972.p1  ORF type:complete len:68 (-),score=5.63 NODE_30583_length_415_cov_0.815972:13-216(-)